MSIIGFQIDITPAIQRLTALIKEKVRPANCGMCKWYSDDRFCEVGKEFVEQFLGISCRDVPRYVRRLQKSHRDSGSQVSHEAIHRVLALAAITGFLAHFIQTIPLLIMTLRWIEQLIDGQLEETAVLNAIRGVQYYSRTMVQDELKDSLRTVGLNQVIEDIYKQRTEVLDRIQGIGDHPSSQDIREIIKAAQDLVDNVNGQFTSFAVLFAREGTALRSRLTILP